LEDEPAERNGDSVDLSVIVQDVHGRTDDASWCERPGDWGGSLTNDRYIRKSEDAPASYAVIESEARVVRQVYDHYIVTGWSIGAITRWLNDEGVPTRKAGTRWERSTVWAMLRNPAYIGTACFGKTRIATRQRVTRRLRLRDGLATRDSANHERPREEWIEIPVPALIDEPTFARAHELLQMTKCGRDGGPSPQVSCRVW